MCIYMYYSKIMIYSGFIVKSECAILTDKNFIKTPIETTTFDQLQQFLDIYGSLHIMIPRIHR